MSKVKQSTIYSVFSLFFYINGGAIYSKLAFPNHCIFVVWLDIKQSGCGIIFVIAHDWQVIQFSVMIQVCRKCNNMGAEYGESKKILDED